MRNDNGSAKPDSSSTIVIAPNRPHDPQYIQRRIAKAITVSLETLPTVKSLPELGIHEKADHCPRVARVVASAQSGLAVSPSAQNKSRI